jgi:hypothetical protein
MVLLVNERRRKVYTNLLVDVVVVERKFEIIIVCARRASEMSHFRSHVEGRRRITAA